MNEQTLKDKLEKLEALCARPGTDGERVAAGLAIERIKARLEDIKKYDPEVEYKFSLRDVWSHMLFLALCRRYGLKPYRYTRQRHTTVMLRVPASFVQQTLWPEFEELNQTLQEYLREITEKTIREVVHQDTSEETVVENTLEIPQ